MAEKQSYAEQNRARLKDITDSIETGIRELFESDKYRQYLATMSRFHKYSVNNTMLIYMFAAWLLARLQGLRRAIQERVYG